MYFQLEVAERRKIATKSYIAGLSAESLFEFGSAVPNLPGYMKSGKC